MFEGTTALSKSGILLSSWVVVHAFVADVGLLSVLQGSQFDPKEAYLAYHCSSTVDSKDETSVGCFPYVSSSDGGLYIYSRVITEGMRTVRNVQVKKWTRVVSVLLKPGHRKTLAKAADAVNSVLDSSTDF